MAKNFIEQLNAHTSKRSAVYYGVDMTWTLEADVRAPRFVKDNTTYEVTSVYVDAQWSDADAIPNFFAWMRAVSIRKDGSRGNKRITVPFYPKTTEASPEFKLRMMQMQDLYLELANRQINAQEEQGFIRMEELEAVK